MGLVDEAAELTLLEGQGLLRVDLFDHREVGGWQTRQGEATTAAADGDPFPFGAQRHAGLLGQRFENIEQLATGDGDIARLLHAHLLRCNELHLEVGAGDAQPIIPRRQQHVREHGHGLPPLDNADNALQGSEEILASRG